MTEDQMFEAVTANDANYDGLFFYAVKSTGIFCRPSCASKKPLRENVCFFRNADEAMKAGFRPCKRCRSDLLSYRPMAEIAAMVRCHLDELYERQTAWNDELNKIGLSEHRAVEIFKDAYAIAQTSDEAPEWFQSIMMRS